MLVATYLERLEWGTLQEFRNLAVVPLLANEESGPDYLTLGEALAEGAISISEIAESGSVPELKVINRASMAVLLVDGEELAGAKQNRALNTTILLPQQSETIIPVSCTEQGRWSYTSREFSESGNVLPHKLRTTKQASVRASLLRERSFRSDQGAVWQGIGEMSRRAATVSPTSAMRDVYQTRATDLQAYVQAFGCVERQVGLLVFVAGQVAGFDVVSRASAYRRLHAKLLKSYAMDALLDGEGSKAPTVTRARAFLRKATQCQEVVFPSVGLGNDHRLTGRNIAGSALVVDDAVVHTAFFAGGGGTNDSGGMASARRRRRFRSDQHQ